MYKIQNLIVATTMVATMIITPIFADASIKDTDLGQSNGSKKLETTQTPDIKTNTSGGQKNPKPKNKNKNNNNNNNGGGSTTSGYTPNSISGENTYGEWQKVREYYGDTYIHRTEFNFFHWQIWETNFDYSNKKSKLINQNTKENFYLFNAPRYSYYTAQAIEHRTRYLKKKKYKVYKRLVTSTSYLGQGTTWEFDTKISSEDAGTQKYTIKPKVWNMYLKKGPIRISDKITKKVEEIEVQHRLVK